MSGFHHAHADHGEGFCTFNGLVVTIDALRAAGAVAARRRARHGPALRQRHRVAGAGAAVSVQHVDLRQRLLPEPGVPRRQPSSATPTAPTTARSRCRTAADAPRCSPRWSAASPQILAWGRPDLLLYQAGADPYREDPYSPLALDHDDLLARDRRVFEFARARAHPDRLGAGRRLHEGHVEGRPRAPEHVRRGAGGVRLTSPTPSGRGRLFAIGRAGSVYDALHRARCTRRR